MNLVEAKIQKWMRITAIEEGQGLDQKLRQLGLAQGDCIRVLRTAPLGGPLLVESNGRSIALGRGVAEKISVEETECASL